MAKIRRIRRTQPVRTGNVQKSLRAALLPLLPLPFVAAGLYAIFSADGPNLPSSLAALALSLTSAILVWKGRTEPPQPGPPVKTFAALCYGSAAATMLVQSGSHPLLTATTGFVAVTLLFTALFGRDFPVRTAPLAAAVTLDELRQQAEGHLTRLKALAAHSGDATLTARITALCDTAAAITAAAEQETAPDQRLRRFFRTWLPEAERTVAEFVHNPDKAPLSPEFSELLTSLEQLFTTEKNRLQERTTRQLELHMDVLQKRLNQENPE